MQTIGVLGGMSSSSTMDYYARLNAGVNEALGGTAGADIALYSVNRAIIDGYLRRDEWDLAGRYLAEKAEAVERSGAAFLLLATNMMHRVAPAIVSTIGIPFLHIVDVIAEAALDDDARRLGVLGTRPVMEPGFYSERFAAVGIELVAPEPADQDVVQAVIFDELTRGHVREESGGRLTRIAASLADWGVDGIVLGCTELGLLVRSETLNGMAVYDSTALHVERAVQVSLGVRDLPALR